MVTRKEIDQATGTETTGHEWDGIKELNTPLPRWWLWVFYATVVWAVGYWVLYPCLADADGLHAGSTQSVAARRRRAGGTSASNRSARNRGGC